jgi:Na+-transporting NADH:ubiquinone oxidoreductase subunit C
MQAESTKKTIIVALAVCIVCSILVVAPTVLLKDKQDANKRLDKIKNILEAADLLKENIDVEAVYNENITPEIVDLATGEIISKDKYTEVLNPEKFDVKVLTKDPQYTQELSQEKDKARIRVIPKNMLVYFVKKSNKIEKIVLPVYGKGLYGSLFGVVALGKDLKTIEGITFYEHGETPGLGGEVDNPRWKAQWKGKVVYDEKWDVRITVNKKGIVISNLDQKFQIDGLSGATLTTRGVNNLVQFWMGQDGYGPLIKHLIKEI